MQNASYVPYLTLEDYLSAIQDGQFNQQVLDALELGTMERQFAESWAMGVFRSKIKHAYDLKSEFSPTLPYNPKLKYGSLDRVTINYPEWESEKSYELDECVVLDNYGYLCQMANSDETFDSSKWFNVGRQYSIYYLPLPEGYTLFSSSVNQGEDGLTVGYYNIGDKVWFKERKYICLRPTIIPDRDTVIQYGTYGSIPPPNIFPTDPKVGFQYWKDEGLYEVDEKPSLPIFESDPQPSWVLGDNRDPMVVAALMDLSIWRLHNRISPMNIPILRENNKVMAMAWLSGINKGSENTDIQPLQPSQGRDFRWGSSTKKQNGIT